MKLDSSGGGQTRNLKSQFNILTYQAQIKYFWFFCEGGNEYLYTRYSLVLRCAWVQGSPPHLGQQRHPAFQVPQQETGSTGNSRHGHLDSGHQQIPAAVAMETRLREQPGSPSPLWQVGQMGQMVGEIPSRGGTKGQMSHL